MTLFYINLGTFQKFLTCFLFYSIFKQIHPLLHFIFANWIGFQTHFGKVTEDESRSPSHEFLVIGYESQERFRDSMLLRAEMKFR